MIYAYEDKGKLSSSSQCDSGISGPNLLKFVKRNKANCEGQIPQVHSYFFLKIPVR